MKLASRGEASVPKPKAEQSRLSLRSRMAGRPGGAQLLPASEGSRTGLVHWCWSLGDGSGKGVPPFPIQQARNELVVVVGGSSWGDSGTRACS